VSTRTSRLLTSALAAAAAALLVLGAAAAADRSQSASRGSFQLVGSGFVDPTYVTSAPGDPGTLYVVEQAGTIRTFQDGRITGTFLDIRDRVRSGGELGLLSMAFHPRYAQNHLFYVDYTDLAGDTRVVEFRAPNGVADPASARELLFVDQPYPNHKGGQLEFDRAGLLYVGMGDGGTNPAGGGTAIGDPENRAQNMASSLGKLLRIDPTRAGAKWQVVGLGLRNPWRFSFDRKSGDLWIGDVGAATYEELDRRPRALIGKLANYGWSHYEGRAVYNRRVALRAGKLVQPVYVYGHGGGACGVIGGYVYRGTRVAAARGRYFFGDLCSGAIWSFRLGKHGLPSGPRAFAGTVSGLSSFGEDAHGELYALSLGGDLHALR
jgi:glucose/arabinose dehydrogenase